MQSTEFVKNIEDTYKVCIEIIKKKNQDYAKTEDPFANIRLSALVGVDPKHAILVRLSDKISRMSNLLDKPPAVVEESIQDSIFDAINYMAILKAFIDSEK